MHISIRPVSKQGQVSLPVEIRKNYLKLSEQDKVAFIENEQGQIILKKADLSDLIESDFSLSKERSMWVEKFKTLKSDPDILNWENAVLSELGQVVLDIMEDQGTDYVKFKRIKAAREAYCLLVTE